MNTTKSSNVTVTLDDDTFATFREASEIVEKAGIRVPTSQLVQTMLNAEMQRLSPRKIGVVNVVFERHDCVHACEHGPEISFTCSRLGATLQEI